MRADGDIDFALGYVGDDLLQLFRRDEAAEHRDAHRERLETALESFIVLESKHRGGRQSGHLLAVAERLERGAHHNFGFSEAHVAA